MIRSVYITGAGVLLIALFLWLGFSKDKPQTAQTADVVIEAIEPITQSAQELYDLAVTYANENELVKAKEEYSKILNNYPDFEKIQSVQKELEDTNIKIIFSNLPTKNAVFHIVKSGDTLGKLAKQYGTTINLIKINNNLKSDIIRIEQRLRIWTGAFNLLVDKSQNILILKEGQEVVKVYNVSTGEESSTPVGTFKITSKLVDPVWFNRGVVVPPESPENVLGSRWLGFDMPGYGIHGTVEPDTIGQQVTAGCVRMRNNEVEELYTIVPLGTQVQIIN